jgi:hypothetical protein
VVEQSDKEVGVETSGLIGIVVRGIGLRTGFGICVVTGILGTEGGVGGGEDT